MATVSLSIDDGLLELEPDDMMAHSYLSSFFGKSIEKTGERQIEFKGTVYFTTTHGMQRIRVFRDDIGPVVDDGWPAGSFDEWVQVSGELSAGSPKTTAAMGGVRASKKLEFPNEVIDALTTPLDGRSGPQKLRIAVEGIQDTFEAAHKALDVRLARILKAHGRVDETKEHGKYECYVDGRCSVIEDHPCVALRRAIEALEKK